MQTTPRPFSRWSNSRSTKEILYVRANDVACAAFNGVFDQRQSIAYATPGHAAHGSMTIQQINDSGSRAMLINDIKDRALHYAILDRSAAQLGENFPCKFSLAISGQIDA
jgi:hypothetical protein